MLDEQRPFAIILDRPLVKMNFAIEFDREFFGRTVEIENVRTNAVLPTEFAAIELGVLDQVPKRSLGGTEVFTQLFSEPFELRQ